ncbi:heparan-alpha-glucosaminide N-acetyltransferase domain-containing protein [Archangium violaceum]|uniref:acyltransferase family protein n=1 Tax=Archangium violaceum TaxID=83451 RepID=UPI002B2820C8|nr:heparan-alpha-glucosaminide N-acetyltransferase domain-containing protein [Archangium gephyra]
MTPPGTSLFDLRKPSTRHPGLDGARGLAVVAMVLGHTLDALLAPEMRATAWVQRYWELRGITAPLFLLVAGFAVVAALGTSQESAGHTFGRRARRALLLLFLGYLVHWPGWDTVHALGWGEPLRSLVFTFDALQSIAVSLLVGAAVLVLARGTWTRAVVLGVLAVGIPLASTWMWSAATGWPVELRQAVGMPGARFPLFPWAGFFFAGALAAHLLRLLRPGWPQGLALLALGTGLLVLTRQLTPGWSPTSAWLVAFRVGQGFLVLGAVNLLPRFVSGLLAPLGRSSLWLYVLHLPVVYGWAGTPGLAGRVGPTLGLLPALGVGLGLLAVCFAIARLWQVVRGKRSPSSDATTWRARPVPMSNAALRSGQRI